MKKNKNLTINITEWVDGKLTKKDIIAETLGEAISYIKTLRGNDIKVKVYDENMMVYYSETINNGKGHTQHGKGHGYGHDKHDHDYA